TGGGMLGKIGRGGAKAAASLGSKIPALGATLAGGGKLLKFLRLGKSIPIIGSLFAAGFALKDIWGMASKVMGGEAIGAGDIASLGLNLASLIPGIGTAAAIADVGMGVTGGYDKLNQAASIGGATTPAGPSVKEMPMTGLPETEVAGGGAGGSGNLPPGITASGQSSAQGYTAKPTASIIQGAQGANIKIDFGEVVLPMSQVHAMNQNIAGRATRGPTG